MLIWFDGESPLGAADEFLGVIVDEFDECRRGRGEGGVFLGFLKGPEIRGVAARPQDGGAWMGLEGDEFGAGVFWNVVDRQRLQRDGHCKERWFGMAVSRSDCFVVAS